MVHMYEEKTTVVTDQGFDGRSPTIRLHANDDVVIARHQVEPGTRLPEEGDLLVTRLIPPGHKVATRAIRTGEAVHRYNQVIGVATQDIAPGDHAHTHNVGMAEFERDYAFCADASPTEYAADPATFMGIVRQDGSVATRNYIGIIISVNCSATVARAIADHFRRDLRPDALADYPNVDGVVALTHGYGCAVDPMSEGLAILQRTLAGYACHPNFSAVLMIGLGCETNQIGTLLQKHALEYKPNLHQFTIQETGGTSKTIARRNRAHQGDPTRSQQGEARTCAGQSPEARAAMRRLGWVLRHHRQSSARRGRRSPCSQRGHRDPVRDA